MAINKRKQKTSRAGKAQARASIVPTCESPPKRSKRTRTQSITTCDTHTAETHVVKKRKVATSVKANWSQMAAERARVVQLWNEGFANEDWYPGTVTWYQKLAGREAATINFDDGDQRHEEPVEILDAEWAEGVIQRA